MKVTSTRELREDVLNTLNKGKKYSIETRDYSTLDGQNKGGVAVPLDVHNYIYRYADACSPLLFLSNLVASDIKNHRLIFEKNKANKFDVMAEGAKKTTFRDSDFFEINLSAKKITEFYRLSSETLHDTSTDFLGYAAERLADEFYNSIEWYLINGNGVQQPQGLLKYSVSEGAKETVTAASNAIQLAELEQAFNKLEYANQKRAVLLCSPSCLNALRTLKSSCGEHLIKEHINHLTVFGCPVIVSEHMPKIGTAGNVPAMFVDTKDAISVLLQNGMDIDIMKELWSANDLIGVKGSIHFDSKIARNNAISVIKLG